MSGPFGSSQWMYSSGGFYDFPIEQSLKFNDDDSSYLQWTPTTSGNRKTWTWSGWVKRSGLGAAQKLFAAGLVAASYNYHFLYFDPSDRLVLAFYPNTNNGWLTTAMRFRDTSAWYHIQLVWDTTQATASNRIKLYVNGEQVTQFETGAFATTYPSQNQDGYINYSVYPHRLGRSVDGDQAGYGDYYLAEVNFIDGQALDPTSFGEFKSGVWIPKDPSGLTYGTNGFRLSFQNDTVSEGFNTVTYRGAGVQQSINGVGFAPDLVWVKNRDTTNWHNLYDSVRGATKELFSNATNAETTTANSLLSFDADGFTVGAPNDSTNKSGSGIVAWCWDAGSGSAASNTDGSITSTVKANTAYGFSIVSYTGNGTGGATVGHGLSSAPEMVIVKERGNANGWYIYHDALGPTKTLYFLTNAAATVPIWNNTAPTSSVISYSGGIEVNRNGGTYIAYAFHSVSNYSSVGSYTGTGANGNAISLGWKPAFVLVKKSSNTGNWVMLDGNRFSSTNQYHLNADLSDGEYTDMVVQFTDTGFTVGSTGGINHSGETFVYLAIKDTRDNAFWRDQSGNGNDWQPNNLTYQDSLPDSTTNNFATLNPVDNTGTTLSEGNLSFSGGATSLCGSTIGVSSGKWYWECQLRSTINSSNPFMMAFVSTGDTKHENYTQGVHIYSDNSAQNKLRHYQSGSLTQTITIPAAMQGFAVGDIIQFAYDGDTGKVWIGVDNIWADNSGGTTGDPSTGSNPTFTLSDPTLPMKALKEHAGVAWSGIVNFGQDSSFAGTKVRQGNADANGIGDFYYDPSDYLAICTANLPNPTIDPAQDDVPSDYFNTVLYTGNGSTNAITGVGFQPDFVWTKLRSQAGSHSLSDVIRGGTAVLRSDLTNAEVTRANHIQSFDTDGFTLGADGTSNLNGTTNVAWNWLAGNGTSSNTNGSITSTVSVNQKAGFSIVSYTGNGTAGATIGHSLGAVPAFIMIKGRTNSDNWMTKHQSYSSNLNFIELNTTNALGSATDVWNNTAPTSTVFSVGTGATVNSNGVNYICYAFAEVESYSKFGSYTGNGSTDGPFVYCGFRPAFVLYKNADGAGNSWLIFDEARTPYNQEFLELKPDSSAAESPAGSYAYFDFLSNGFKPRTTSTALNASGQKIIFAAFASNPFKYANAR